MGNCLKLRICVILSVPNQQMCGFLNCVRACMKVLADLWIFELYKMLLQICDSWSKLASSCN